MTGTYYNEIDPYCAAWLRNLMTAGLIPAGDVDVRPIQQVCPDDLKMYIQCHFFAGIAGWPYALRLAGWPDSLPIWTGSCPCQPFSIVGKRKGFADERDLWPHWFRLIRECRPATIFGEQVTGGSGGKLQSGLQRVRDLEAINRVLQSKGILGRLPDEMQSLLLQTGAGEQGQNPSDGAFGEFQELPDEEQSQGSLHRGEVSSQGEGLGIQSGPGGHCGPARDSRLRRVPVDWNSTQPGRGEDLGQSLLRPDRLDKGIYKGKCSRGPILRERHGEHMGSKQDPGDCGSDSQGTEHEVGHAANQSGEGFASAADWLARVRSDLEGVGYAMGAMPIQAACAGAAQYRDRYWFVAQLSGESEREPQYTLSPIAREGAWLDSSGAGAGLDAGPLALGHLQCPGDSLLPRSGQLGGAGGAAGDPVGAVAGHPGQQAGSPRQPWERSDVVRPPLDGWGQGWTEHEFRGRGFSASVASSPDGSVQFIECPDGKWRRLPPPRVRWLGTGIPARVPKLRALGNAIYPPLAVQVIRAYMEVAP